MSAHPGIGGTTRATHISADSAAQSLGAFLRRMRDRAEPRAARRTTRRRALGMRREEVAIEAGISVTWYTWLEQGRPVRVSRRTLLGIARALRLDSTERAHLLRLAKAASSPALAASISSEASPSLRSLADALAPHPAYVVNALWDVLHANDAASMTFGDFQATPGVTDNVLRRLFLDDTWRARFVDWSAVTASAVAQFRAATAHLVGDARWNAFITRLARESDAFSAQWREHKLAPSHSREKMVAHPVAGRLSFLYASFAPDAEPADARVIVYMPSDAGTAAAMRSLTRAARSE